MDRDRLYSRKWDKCLAKVATYGTVGAVSGGLFKAVLFKKAPLIAVGTAFGLGMAVTECQYTFIESTIKGYSEK